ncbi:MAG: hypothetical protein ACD_71C00145G0001 [uncultured bacterium (gcode 4)]|uniref:Peptidase S8/S53 domain-containing protein n=1 Tax=uncultured bacterium (gcode 4) TaxID=1234023 RepID=K1Z4B9_9BACT|nr:MAG: hypothetical protein ACD_71C00145G0001 [uncultured bacterium (gcode 4)]
MKILKEILIFASVLILLWAVLFVYPVVYPVVKSLFLLDHKFDLSKVEEPYWHINQNYTIQVEKNEIMRTVVVAIVDTGTDKSDFPFENILQGFNVIDQNNVTTDQHGHGRVLSHLVASPVNGINKYAMILPVKVRRTMMDDPKLVSEGIIWAVDHGTDIVNLSIGRGPTNTNVHEGYTEGVEYAIDKGVLVIASSGTSGESVYFPGAIEGVFTVGGLDQNHKLRSEMNTDEIDIFAIDTKAQVSSSFPTAIVSGAVSLILALDESLSPEGAIKIILESADREQINGKEVKILNIDEAIKTVRAMVAAETSNY